MIPFVTVVAVGKRSPVLGYNHNVRYRGVVLHVQTEDSGVQNPHVYTHLFHGGVIITTRKLVYDASAAQEVVKSLMQAQHKAVLKDLRSGAFEDKIDLLLADVPGLLPRGATDPGEAPPDVGDSPEDATVISAPPQMPSPKSTMPRGSGSATPVASGTQAGESAGAYRMHRKRESNAPERPSSDRANRLLALRCRPAPPRRRVGAPALRPAATW